MLQNRPSEEHAATSWRQTTFAYLRQIFGSDDPNVHAVMNAGIKMPTGTVMNVFGSRREPSAEEKEAKAEQGRAEVIIAALSRLDSCIEQLEATVEETEGPTPVGVPQIVSTDVFLVHGHDDGTRQTVPRFLEHLGLRVIILDEQASRGRTIVEKFEDHASEAGYAVVLMTGDDKGGVKTADPSTFSLRARQNVIFQLGYFSAKLGRGRVCALHDSGVEIPSDYQGVVYVPLDAGGTWKLLLGRELRDAQLPVDMNRI